MNKETQTYFFSKAWQADARYCYASARKYAEDDQPSLAMYYQNKAAIASAKARQFMGVE